VPANLDLSPEAASSRITRGQPKSRTRSESSWVRSCIHSRMPSATKPLARRRARRSDAAKRRRGVRRKKPAAGVRRRRARATGANGPNRTAFKPLELAQRASNHRLSLFQCLMGLELGQSPCAGQGRSPISAGRSAPLRVGSTWHPRPVATSPGELRLSRSDAVAGVGSASMPHARARRTQSQTGLGYPPILVPPSLRRGSPCLCSSAHT
jgi:hypothetical protein